MINQTNLIAGPEVNMENQIRPIAITTADFQKKLAPIPVDIDDMEFMFVELFCLPHLDWWDPR